MAKYKLKELCEFITDGTHQTPEYCGNDGVIFLSSKDVTERKINWDSVKYIPNALHEKLCKRLKPRKNDILLAKNGTTGVAAIVDRDEIFDVYVSLAVLRPLNVVYPKYLLYAINSPVVKRQFDAGLKGVGVPNLHLSVIKETWINVVKKEGQQKVCKVLDKIEKIIELKKQELQLLDELIKARFVEMFGTLDNPSQEFVKATLKELCNKITDGKHGGCKAEEGTERYFVGAREIYDDEVHYDTAPEINIDEFEKDYKRCNIEIGDFLIVNTGATIGKSAIATDKRTKHTLLQKSVALLKVKKDVLNPVFLKWCYRVNKQMYIVESASAQPNLLLSKINSTVIYVPDIELQNQFASFVEQVDKSKVAVQKSLDETQLLFDSLMQKYFG